MMQTNHARQWNCQFLVFVLFALFLTGQVGGQDTGPAPAKPGGQAGPEDSINLVLTFAGDLMAHKPNYSMKGYDRIYERLLPFLQSDDLSFINLEAPVDETSPQATFPQFNVHKPYVQAAISAGFDVFSLANNHSYDRYAKGTRRTLKAMDELAALPENAIYHSGLRADGEAPDAELRSVEIKVKGLRIGFVAIAEYMNFLKHDGSMYHINYLDEKIRKRLLAWLDQETTRFDLYILSIHTGIEYERKPSKAFSALAPELVAAGVDVVWAHHPHVLQPWYTLPGPDGAERLILPSMGNFVSGQTWELGPEDHAKDRAWTGDSALVQVTVRIPAIGTDRTPRIEKVAPLLIGHYKDPRGGVVVWPYSQLMTEAKGSWKKFFTERFKKLTGFYPGSEAATLEFKVPSPKLP